MNKDQFLIKLQRFKKSIESFQKEKMTIINVPHSELIREEKYASINNDTNPSLHKALVGIEYQNASQKRRETVYGIKKRKLKRDYGELIGYIQRFGLNPHTKNQSCYDLFFLNDIWSIEDANYISIISDIEIIIGKVHNMSDSDFQNIAKNDSQNYWKILHPVWWALFLIQFFRKYKKISAVIIFVLCIFVTQSIEPFANVITKPLQDFLLQIFMNK